ncbi:N-acetylmuramoyl-L-alanine amidase, partial [Anaerosalibacter bizertensis]|nr:N-acetylmuramoyl-L-alanine amidase [Anaerosalibacter bizertensis]
NKDENILLNKRTKMADSIRPDFFISFHMDFFANSNNRGCKAYYFRGDEESKKLGVKILEEIERDINIKNKGVREGDFYLLKNLNTSSLIIELGYLSNLEEEKKFSDKRFIKQFSEAIGKGILQYFEY